MEGTNLIGSCITSFLGAKFLWHYAISDWLKKNRLILLQATALPPIFEQAQEIVTSHVIHFHLCVLFSLDSRLIYVFNKRAFYFLQFDIHNYTVPNSFPYFYDSKGKNSWCCYIAWLHFFALSKLINMTEEWQSARCFILFLPGGSCKGGGGISSPSFSP